MSHIDLLRRELRDSYVRSGVASGEFSCPQLPSCQKAVGGRELSNGSDSHVGSSYGQPFRLVVASMDRGQGSEDIWQRIRSVEALGSTGLNAHMRGTLHLLRKLIRIEAPQVWRHFAMTNTAKCCYSGPGMASVKPALYRNCAPYAVNELDILRPDLIVTQGKKARLFTVGRTRVLPGALAEEALEHADCNTVEERSLLHRRVKILSLDRTDTLLLESVHPSARHYWYRFRDQELPLLVRVVRHLVGAP